MNQHEPIHILATCRKPELLPAATLVFRTIRVGFPVSPIRLSIKHGCDRRSFLKIKRSAEEIGAEWAGTTHRSHDDWIQRLIDESSTPFWICDTDVVFWKQFEFEPDSYTPIAGVWTPEFYEPWTRTFYRERLHTCLMRIDPFQFSRQCGLYLERCPTMPFRPKVDFVSQQWQPERDGHGRVDFFYDTLAMAWHALGGQRFSPEQIDSFDHLNCATYADLIGPAQDFDMQAAHAAIYEDPTRARGLWAKQMEWFAAHTEATNQEIQTHD
jgi:hypothetical protein